MQSTLFDVLCSVACVYICKSLFCCTIVNDLNWYEDCCFFLIYNLCLCLYLSLPAILLVSIIQTISEIVLKFLTICCMDCMCYSTLNMLQDVCLQAKSCQCFWCSCHVVYIIFSMWSGIGMSVILFHFYSFNKMSCFEYASFCLDFFFRLLPYLVLKMSLLTKPQHKNPQPQLTSRQSQQEMNRYSQKNV